MSLISLNRCSILDGFTNLGNERHKRREYIFVVHLCTDVEATVYAQIAIHGRTPHVRNQPPDLSKSSLSPQCPRCLNDHFLLTVREARDQRAYDIFALQQPPCRRIVLNEIGDSDTSPFPLRRIKTFHLHICHIAMRCMMLRRTFVDRNGSNLLNDRQNCFFLRGRRSCRV